MLKDDETADVDILLIQEPHIFDNGDGIPSAPTHPKWTTHLPTTTSQTAHIRHSFRSLIWIHRRLTSTQIPVKSSDITAVIVEVAEHVVVTISVYIPYAATVNENEQLLKTRLKLVKATHQYVEQLKGKKAELLVGEDFNRHDQFWGGNKIARTPRQGEGARVIDFMLENNLQLLFSRGTPTYESYNGVNSSTIDLSLASQHLTNLLTKCEVLPMEHGYDHRAIEILFEISFEKDLAPVGRRLYEKANWARIQESLRANMPHHRICRTKNDLEEYNIDLLHNIILCLGEIPKAKPSPYAKRWWTPVLTELRKDMSTWLNRWTTSKRQGSPCMLFLVNARQAKQLTFKK